MAISKLVAGVGGDGGNSTGTDIETAVNALIDNNVLTAVVSMGSSAPNAATVPSVNTIDPATGRSLITSLTDASWPNHIGIKTVVPAGVSETVSGEWAVDSAYVAGAADVASIQGGYDNIVNQIAGHCIGANHSYIESNPNGHSSIISGSYCWISAGRSVIANGLNCKITGVATLSCGIDSSRNSSITAGEHNSISGSKTATITSTGNYNSIMSSDGCNVTGTGSQGVVIASLNTDVAAGNSTAIGCFNTTVSGQNALTAGCRDTTVSGTFGFAVGVENGTLSHAHSSAAGKDVVTITQGGHHVSPGKLVVDGDNGSVQVPFSLRTTDATLTNMSVVSSSSIFIDLDDTKTNMVTCKVLLVGVREDTGAGCSYELDFMGEWDGTTGRIYDSAGDATTRNLNVISNQLGILTAPHIAINGGALRPKVTGLAGVNIKWSASMSLVLVNF